MGVVMIRTHIYTMDVLSFYFPHYYFSSTFLLSIDSHIVFHKTSGWKLVVIHPTMRVIGRWRVD